jgi:uncharacterized membrane protein YcaP (DUF421 family)
MDATFLPTTQLPLLILRAVVVYVFLLAALRLAGRREMGQMTSFDLVLLLLISNAVQNSINAGDNSLTSGLVSAVVLVTLNWLAGYAAYRWRWAERLLQGRPQRMVTDGKVHFGAMRKELLTLAELRSALRKQGVSRIGECARVDLEPDGTLSVLRSDVRQRSAAELAHPLPILRGWTAAQASDDADAGRS